MASAQYNKGIALGAQGKYDEAIKAYDKIIKVLFQNMASAQYNKGIALGAQGKYDEA